MERAQHDQQLPLPENGGGKAPNAIHLLPKAQIKGRDGRDFLLGQPEKIIRDFNERKIDLPIDYEHQTEERDKRTGPIPAAGWITKLEYRDDGLWGHVKWTAQAEELIANQEYRFVSPTFLFNKQTREIVRLTGAGLVHAPNLYLTALSHEEETSTMSQDPLFGPIAAELGLAANATQEDVLNCIRTLKEPDPEKFIPVSAVEGILKSQQAERKQIYEQRATEKVDKAVYEGYITPGMRDWAMALCRQNPESFDAFVDSTSPAFAYLFQSQFDGKKRPSAKQQSATDAEQAVCRQLGIDPNSLAKG